MTVCIALGVEAAAERVALSRDSFEREVLPELRVIRVRPTSRSGAGATSGSGTRPTRASMSTRVLGCGITAPNFHHAGCEFEMCPACEGELTACECEYLFVRAE
jgi:hypothetical protein